MVFLKLKKITKTILGASEKGHGLGPSPIHLTLVFRAPQGLAGLLLSRLQHLPSEYHPRPLSNHRSHPPFCPLCLAALAHHIPSPTTRLPVQLQLCQTPGWGWGPRNVQGKLLHTKGENLCLGC